MDGCWGHAKWAPHFVGGRCPSKFFLEIADLFGLVLLEAVPLYLRMHSPTLPVTGQVDKRVLNCECG